MGGVFWASCGGIAVYKITGGKISSVINVYNSNTIISAIDDNSFLYGEPTPEYIHKVTRGTIKNTKAYGYHCAAASGPNSFWAYGAGKTGSFINDVNVKSVTMPSGGPYRSVSPVDANTCWAATDGKSLCRLTTAKGIDLELPLFKQTRIASAVDVNTCWVVDYISSGNVTVKRVVNGSVVATITGFSDLNLIISAVDANTCWAFDTVNKNAKKIVGSSVVATIPVTDLNCGLALDSNSCLVGDGSTIKTIVGNSVVSTITMPLAVYDLSIGKFGVCTNQAFGGGM